MREAKIEQHGHVFLGEAHAASERNVWAVIALTLVMMVVEIVGGAWFGSIALVADGFHMSTHAGALLLAALAYTLARRYANDARFTFGVGKFGDLAGFSSAVILGMIALEIAYESATRLFAPTPIAFAQAIPIAALGLVVNVASAWLLTRGGHDHGPGHAHSPGPGEAAHSHDHGVDRDHNMRAAIVHVIADAGVSVLVIVGLTLAKLFGWLWMDPFAGLVGAVVIASWALSLIRDTACVLLDVNADPRLCQRLRDAVEGQGDSLADLHVWRLGPGHLGAIVAVETASGRGVEHYRELERTIGRFSHLTIEVLRSGSAAEAPRRDVA